jgi:signal peptidase I
MGIQTVYVVSDNPSSMSPTINYGDVALTYKAPFSSLGVGDIIFFHDPRGNPGIIVHRIYAVENCSGQLCFMTKGDNDVTNPTPDPWTVSSSNYLSQVEVVVPGIGYLSPAFWGFGGVSVVYPLAFLALLAFFVAYGRNLQKGEAAEKKAGEQHG